MIDINKKLEPTTENEDVSINPNYMSGEILTAGLKNVLNVKYPAMAALYRNNSNWWYNDIGAANRIATRLLKWIKEDSRWVNKIISQYNDAETGLFRVSRKLITTDLFGLDKAELFILMKRFEEAYRAVHVFGWLPIGVEGFIGVFSNDLKKFLYQHLVGGDLSINNYFIHLTTPKKKTRRMQADDMVARFVRSGNTTVGALNKFIDEYLAKFSWLGYNYLGPELNRTDVKNLVKETVHAPIRTSRLNYNINIVEQDALYKRLFRIASDFMFMKNSQQETLFYANYAWSGLVRILARRLRLTQDMVRVMTFVELGEALAGTEMDRKALQERCQNSLLIFDKGKVEIVSDKKIIQNFLDTKIAKIKTSPVSRLKGQAACPGKVRGNVRIINSPTHMGEMQVGEILVSGKTNPSFLPAMKKAAGIVTDYGGLTCHAAIVSREINTPCIIGTKIATKVLKNGDLVEVDSYHGVVRILERIK